MREERGKSQGVCVCGAVGGVNRMEVVSTEHVKEVANELFPDNQAEGVLSLVASEVELQMRQVVQDAAKFMRRARRQRMTTQDIDLALKHRTLPAVHGYTWSDPSTYKMFQNRNVFFLEEEDVDLKKLQESNEKLFLPTRIPLKPTFGIHWLAVDGIQPTIKENPHIHGSTAQDTTLAVKRSKASAEVARDQLSRELQIYFEKVVHAVEDSALGNVAAQRSLFTSVSQDPGLQQLMRYLSKFVHETVTNNTRNLRLLWSVMRLTRSILVNPNLDKELYLHQLMPAILTCIVHKELCSNYFQDHWSLRRFAAELLPIIVYSKCGQKYEMVKARVIKTLQDALVQNDRPMTTQYGAIVGITAMGPLTVQVILLPIMRKSLLRYGKLVEASTNEGKRFEAQQCIGALQTSFGKYTKSWKSPDLSSAVLLDVHLKPARSAVAAIGEATLPWTCSSDVSDVCQLFV